MYKRQAKCGGNYAASLLPQQEAVAQGCSQVLFLDPVEGKYLEELGGMNVFLVFKDGSLVTPEPVSYTHLDVYKRQIQIRVKKTLPSSSKSGASQRARGVGEVAGIGAPA